MGVKMHLHQFVETFPLLWRELVTQFFLNIIIFVVNIRRDLVPEVADARLGIGNDFLDACMLFGRQIKVLLDPAHQFNLAQLFERQWLGSPRAGSRRVNDG